MISPAESSRVEQPITVAAVVPVWLQDALAVLLKSERDVKLIACTASVQTLLLLSLDQVPDLVIFQVAEQDDRASNQVKQIKAVWPASRCLVVVDHSGQQGLMRETGADEVMLKGILPQKLLATIFRTATNNDCRTR
jgi:DNA-binding NarL/FixJ family response regulator